MTRGLVALLLVLACGGKPSGSSSFIAELDRGLAERPDDAVLLMWRAYFTAESGRSEEAIGFLERLDRTGWDIPFAPSDFKILANDPRFRAIATRVAARAPAVSRSELAFTLPDPEMIPEGIAVDPTTGTFYVGSIRKRMIVAVDPDKRTRTFVQGHSAAVLGMKVDPARGLLWVASYADPGMERFAEADRGRAAVTAFALADGARRREVELRGGGDPHLFNDVALAPDGTVYVTDSVAGRVWRIPSDRDVLEPITPPAAFTYPNGIVYAWTDRLLVAHRTGIAIVDPRSGAITPMASTAPIAGIDGLLLEGRTMYGVQNNLGAARLVAIALDETGTRAAGLAILENTAATLVLPTTAAFYDKALYTIANAQLDAIGPGGLVATKQLEQPRIVRTPVE